MFGSEMREFIEKEIYEENRSMFSPSPSFEEMKQKVGRIEEEGRFPDADMSFAEKIEWMKNSSKDLDFFGD